jgi:hypothetical protein
MKLSDKRREITIDTLILLLIQEENRLDTFTGIYGYISLFLLCSCAFSFFLNRYIEERDVPGSFWSLENKEQPEITTSSQMAFKDRWPVPFLKF